MDKLLVANARQALRNTYTSQMHEVWGKLNRQMFKNTFTSPSELISLIEQVKAIDEVYVRGNMEIDLMENRLQRIRVMQPPPRIQRMTTEQAMADIIDREEEEEEEEQEGDVQTEESGSETEE